MMQKKEDNNKKMSVGTIVGDPLILLLRDAIVQHTPLKNIKLILRYLICIV